MADAAEGCVKHRGNFPGGGASWSNLTQKLDTLQCFYRPWMGKMQAKTDWVRSVSEDFIDERC